MILIPFYFFAAIQMFFSWKSFRSGLEYLRFFRAELENEIPRSDLHAAVIVPCKGRERGLKMNLSALLAQDHGQYEVIFVTESGSDPACPVIREVIDEHPETASRLVTAGGSDSTGQKIQNLIEASKNITDGVDVLVFVDSDSRPASRWLRALLAGLGENEGGCSTGYRWFIPVRGGIPSNLRSAWNASIASALGPDESANFCWGGSTAILRRTFEHLEVARNWEGRLSDDFALTKMIRDSGGGIRFVPACLTATVEDCTIGELLEFTTRQMKITRVYRPDLWLVSLAGSLLFSGTLFAAMVLLFSASGIHFFAAALFLTFILAAGTAKAVVRLRAVSLALPEYRAEIRRQYLWHSLLWMVTPVLFLFNDLAALFSRQIVWRGVEYRIESPGSIRVSRRKDE